MGDDMIQSLDKKTAFGLDRTVILTLQLKAALKTKKQTNKQKLKI